MARSMLLRVCSLPPQTEKRCRGPRVLHGTSTKENTCLTLRYTPFASRLPEGPVRNLLRARRLVNNRKKTSLHESILSGIKHGSGTGPIRRGPGRKSGRQIVRRGSSAAGRQTIGDAPAPAGNGNAAALRSGDGGFLEAFHAARPGWELSAIESGDAFMRLLKKAFLRSAYNADYRDATSFPGSTSSPLPSLWMK